MTLGNSPLAHTVLRVEARKSFKLSVHIHDTHGKPADLTGCQLRIVAKPLPLNTQDDSTNLLGPDAYATLEQANLGYGVFNIQAATLNVAPKEYPFSIVLVTAAGFSTVLVKGTLDVQQNTEVESVSTDFAGVAPAQSLDVTLAPGNRISVFMGAMLPPGMSYVRQDTLLALESFDPDDVAYVPEGGLPGYVLTKTTRDDHAMEWRPVGNGAFALDATNIDRGHTPVANGDGTWEWEAVGIDAVNVAQGFAPIANGDGTWSWGNVTTTKPDWAAASGTAAEILNKPTLGTAAAKNEGDFIAASTLVSAMQGITFQTTVPTSGTEGHIYFVYTP